MGENYCECLTAQRVNGRQQILAVGAVALAVICALAGLFVFLPACIAAVALGVFAWFAMKKVRVEYEYLLLDHEITADAIYGKDRRKRMLRCSTRKIESFAPADPGKLDHLKRQNVKVEDYSSGEPDKIHFLMVCEGDSGRRGFLMTPNEEMLEQMGRELPRSVFPR